ncbi:acyl-CoA synthetase (AMP-forming)/AMP-acid ligase II [Novosphingobium taihuense]|uniref:3-methylmercaptopropionyl-CoA ligase n=2 Tax=Novosphingobium taihuense TaxID=260085 RepID=A0A7W7EWF3_9SPHN|nr:acyl-CoA synthetase (AMP-forming)/AMP-acid ligase II [Novosphingobium taihuense]
MTEMTGIGSRGCTAMVGVYGGLEIGLTHTLPRVIAHVAAKWQDKPFCIDEDGTVTTFAALERRVAGLGAHLLELGVRYGDRVAILAPNCSGWIVAACAAQSVGAILVPINTRFKGPEILYVLRRSGASVLFTVGSFLGTDYASMAIAAGGGASADGRPIAELTRLKALIRIDDQDFAPDHLNEVARNRFAEAAAKVTPDTTLDIMFTSGTTGQPKGAMHGHGQALWMTGLWSQSNDLQSTDRTAIVNPFFHSFGYRSGWMSALMGGMTMWPLSAFDAGEMLALIEREKITQLSGAPTVFYSLMQHPDFSKRDISSLRTGHTGGAKTPPEIIRAGYEVLGFDIFLTSYGQTEATAMISTNYPGDPLDAIVTTVGRPIPGTQVRIVAADGSDVAVGDQGELLVRGPNVMQGFFDDPVQTAATIIDGWLHTGDVACLDNDGRLRILDRLKDVVIVGGFNAYPVEIEIMLGAHPDILEAAVIGLPDERMGEVTAAFVIARDDAEITLATFTAWCREQMANYKVPRHLFLVKELPRTPLGKVQKFELRKQALSALGRGKA